MQYKKDVVIIGAGAIGLCTAYYLVEAGITPVIIERAEPGAGSSRRNAGYVSPSHFVPLSSPGIVAKGLRWMLNPSSPFYIKPRWDMDLIRWGLLFWRSATERHVHDSMRLLRDLSEASLALFDEIEKSGRVRMDLQRRGILNLYRTVKGTAAGAEEAELAHEIGVKVEVCAPQRVQELQPGVSFDVAGGVYWPGDSHIDPEKFIGSMAEYLKSRGVEFKLGEEVRSLRGEGNRVAEVLLDHDSYAADQVVLAGGSWSPVIARTLGVRLPLQAGKGYSVTIPQPANGPTIPMILSEARVAITPLNGSLRFGGTMELAGLDTSVTTRRVRAILDAVPGYLPKVDVSPAFAQTPWAGLRPVTPDGLPYVGRFRSFTNLIAATGHAMVGITLATATGKIVAEIIGSKPPFLQIDALSPERFR
jgi:D-amino-acid dehydrogenase